VQSTRKARLLVYGTLMSGHPQSCMLSELPGAAYLGRAWVRGRLLDLGDYPGAVLDPRASFRIEGELWEVDYRPATFRRLDEYEAFFPGHPERSLFLRRKVRARLGERTVLAWIYVPRRPPRAAPLIATGRWDLR
jgi:gamma-glutamylcyclotransferase (GGCT)/AIG2-like uncharacterized protein YtfP